MNDALQSGNAVAIRVHGEAYGGMSNEFTDSGGHIMWMVGMDDNGMVMVLNPNVKGRDKYAAGIIKYSLDFVVGHVDGDYIVVGP